ncbi:hypothetical protein [Nocardioides ferulae]|uniref:hypothetical protein n=1 Tax=Nocardioides ferulae TaxID=2340821 RepID=UPI000EB38048|nr:hypothetical protein [Nocardioides ferulae]
MSRTALRTVTMLFALTAPFGLAACSGEDAAEKAAEEAIEQGAGGDVEVDVDPDTGDVVVSDSTGTYTSGGDLPDSFPDDLPIIEGDIVSAMSGGEAGETGHVVMVQTDIQDPTEALDEAVGLLTDAGFATGSQSVQIEGMASQDLTRDSLHVVLAVYGGEAGSDSVVQYVVEQTAN